MFESSASGDKPVPDPNIRAFLGCDIDSIMKIFADLMKDGTLRDLVGMVPMEEISRMTVEEQDKHFLAVGQRLIDLANERERLEVERG